MVLTYNVEHEADEPMMCCKRQQHFVDENDMLKVVYHALTIQEVHGRPQEVPIETSRERKIPGSAWHCCNSDDFLKRDDLYGCNDADDVDMPGKEADEEGRDHHEGPYGPGYEGLFLLLVLGLRGRLCFVLLRNHQRTSSLSQC